MGLDTHRVSNKVSKITSRHLVPLDRAFPAHALVHGYFRVTPEAIVGRLVLQTTRAHDRDMKSRVHPKYKTKYHVQNWASYERALVRRGNVTVWLSPEAIAAWEPDGGGTRGGQRKYSDVAIETALTLRLIFHLPLRQADDPEGHEADYINTVNFDLLPNVAYTPCSGFTAAFDHPWTAQPQLRRTLVSLRHRHPERGFAAVTAR